MDVVAAQWELAVLITANWAASHGGALTFMDGEAWVSCPVCGRGIPLSSEVVEGSGVLYCRNADCWGSERQVHVLRDIPYTTFTGAFNACRRLAGGVRGYPLLRGLRVQLQTPVLHCTGTIAKQLVYFILACLPEKVSSASRRIIMAITGKGKLDSLYLREFRELVAAAVACPTIFTEDLDPVFFAMLQLVQLLNAAWRSSLTDPTQPDRLGAAAISQAAAFVLGPLYHEVKPLDPVTKSSKVITLYLHAPLAHVRHQVASRSRVAFVSDDNIEGHIRGIGRYLHNHANNAPQAALLADLAAVRDASLSFVTTRSHPAGLVYTKFLRVCRCWTSLASDGDADFSAIHELADKDSELSVEEEADGDVLLITLPLHERAEANGKRLRASGGRGQGGKKEALRRGLSFRQRTVNACWCGRLIGGTKSGIVDYLLRSRARAAADAEEQAARGTAGAARAPGSSVGSSSQSSAAGATACTSGTRAQLAPKDVEGGGASSDDDARSDVPVPSDEDGGPPATRRHAVVASMPSHLPACWLLKLLFPRSALSGVYPASLLTDAAGPETLDAQDAAFRQQLTVLRLLLTRSKTYAFTSWSVRAGVCREDFTEAVRSVLLRLEHIRIDRVYPRVV